MIEPPPARATAQGAADGETPRIKEPEAAGDELIEGPPLEVIPDTAAHARLGSEGLLRLRARYAEILTRIAERVEDPERQEQLKAEAERLNPDVWVTSDEVTRGLEEYEAVLAALRGAVGGGARKRRRRRRPSAGQTPETAPAPPEGPGGEGGGEDTDDPL